MGKSAEFPVDFSLNQSIEDARCVSAVEVLLLSPYIGGDTVQKLGGWDFLKAERLGEDSREEEKHLTGAHQDSG